MKRTLTLISAFLLGISAMLAGTLADIKSELAGIEGVTVIDASEEIHMREYSINNCEVIMLTPEIMDKVRPILSKIPEDIVFADVNDEDGTKVTIWAEPEEGTKNGTLLIFVHSEGELLAVYAQGNLETMQAGIHLD